MAQQKEQHYVPKFYMKRFANSNTKFFLYNSEKCKEIGFYSYKNQCKMNYYYGKDLVYEQKLCKKEKLWDKSIDSIINNKYDDNTIQNVKEFAIWQTNRTYGMYKNIMSTVKQGNQVLIDYFVNLLSIHKESSKKIVEKTVNDYMKEIISKTFLLDMAEDTSKYINDLNFLHIRYNTNKKLISSDCPIMYINPFLNLRNTTGLAIIGLIILFPISDKDLIVLYDGKLYNKYKDITFIEFSNQSEVNHINELEYINSYKLIYSKNKLNINCFKNYALTMKDTYLRTRIQQFKNNLDGFIGFHFEGIKTKYKFSFAKIPFEFAQIDEKYREEVSRIYNIGFDQKLLYFYTILPQFIFRDRKYYYGDDITAYINKRKEYHQIIRKYWGIN